jgi:hypothetical protein
MAARHANGEARLADGLGWFSIGLGLAEVAAPGTVARLVGAPDDAASRAVLRAYGAREIANGLGILSSTPHPAWLWARVAGDVLDVATIGAAMARPGADATRLAATCASLAPVLLADIAAARRLDRNGNARTARKDRARRVSKVFTVNRSPEEVARLWDRAGVLDGVDAVRFDAAPGGRGTEVRVDFRPHLFGALRKGRVQEKLRQFKQLAETGEVARSSGRASVLQPAQPIAGPRSLAGVGAER